MIISANNDTFDLNRSLQSNSLPRFAWLHALTTNSLKQWTPLDWSTVSRLRLERIIAMRNSNHVTDFNDRIRSQRSLAVGPIAIDNAILSISVVNYSLFIICVAFFSVTQIPGWENHYSIIVYRFWNTHWESSFNSLKRIYLSLCCLLLNYMSITNRVQASIFDQYTFFVTSLLFRYFCAACFCILTPRLRNTPTVDCGFLVAIIIAPRSAVADRATDFSRLSRGIVRAW